MYIPAFILFLQDQKMTDFLLNLARRKYSGLSAGCPAQLKARAVLLVVGGPVFPVRFAVNTKSLLNYAALLYIPLLGIILLSAEFVKKL
jgi:hypothetical protein